MQDYSSSSENSALDRTHDFQTSDILSKVEVEKIRTEFESKHLEEVIEKQQIQRNECLTKKCPFCKHIAEGDRRLIFDHMLYVHGLYLGNPDNIVYADELVDLLQNKIERYICIYCEKVFKNHSVLRLHMRKKKHFRLKLQNKEYDRFYIVNYLEEVSQGNSSWQHLQDEDSDDDSQDIESEAERSRQDTWDEWEDEEIENVQCLFCDEQSRSGEVSLQHAKSTHNFDLQKLKRELGLDFYKCVCMINYIREKVLKLTCPYCGIALSSKGELYEHMRDMDHFGVPNPSTEHPWDDTKYLIPTLENDLILCAIDTDESDDESGT